MGVFVFRTEVLLKLLRWSCPSCNDLGSELIPSSLRDHKVQVMNNPNHGIEFYYADAVKFLSVLDVFVSVCIFRHICSTSTGEIWELSSPSLKPIWN